MVGLFALGTRRDHEVLEADALNQIHEHVHWMIRRQRLVESHDGLGIGGVGLEAVPRHTRSLSTGYAHGYPTRDPAS